jgi:chromate reductase
MTQLIGISGSLRNNSLNTALLASASELAPEGTTLRVASLASIPLYNGDLDIDGGPEPIRALKEQIGAADGLVLATPEYNYGIPGVLKNAIDWASRPAFRSVLAGKPVAIVGAGPGAVGTARAQAQLRQVLAGTLSEVFPHPDFLLANAHEKIQQGALVDEGSRVLLREMLERYVSWING